MALLTQSKVAVSMKDDPDWADFVAHDKHGFQKQSGIGCGKGVDFVASTVVSSDRSKSLVESDLFTDKNVTECEFPESAVCHGENTVKDICVDDGVPPMEKILVDHNNGNALRTKYKTKQEVGVGPLSHGNPQVRTVHQYGTDLRITHCLEVPKHDLDDETVCHSGSQVQAMESEENNGDEVMDDVPIDELLTDDRHLSGKTSKSDFELQSDKIIRSKTTTESAVGVSPEDEPNTGDSDLSYNSKIESGTITFDFNPTSLAPGSIDESLDKDRDHSERHIKINSLPALDSAMPNNRSVENEVQRGQGESGFSMGGSSGLITFSGSIPCSGSLSIRSDSSTTSTRSFAFPILQNEWNSSPVRMAKADRRRYQRDKRWKLGLFCCRS